MVPGGWQGCWRDRSGAPDGRRTRAGRYDAPGVGPSRPWALCGRGGGPGGWRGPRRWVYKVGMGPGGPGLSIIIPQGGATAMAALLGPRRDALYSKPEKSKRLYQHLRHTIDSLSVRLLWREHMRLRPHVHARPAPRACTCTTGQAQVKSHHSGDLLVCLVARGWDVRLIAHVAGRARVFVRHP